MNRLTYGNVPVPYAALWSSEEAMHIAACEFALGYQAMCNAVSPGVGKPIFGKPHMQRQREVIGKHLCDICAMPLKGHTKVSLSHAAVRAGANGLCVMQVEPLLHKKCAILSMQHCPSLKRDIDADELNVRMVTAYHVEYARLSGEATQEFVGIHRSGTIGHAKVVLDKWIDKDMAWLV